MITEIRIRNFKAVLDLGWILLQPFHVLVGPNGSGKTTFLDAIDLLKACLANNPRAAVEERVPQFKDLTYMRRGGSVVVEVKVRFGKPHSNLEETLHYVLDLASTKDRGVYVARESLVRLSAGPGQKKPVVLLEKTDQGKDRYRRETTGYMDSFAFGSDKLALANTPPDTELYGSANRLRDYLLRGVRYVQLNSVAMRQPAPATSPTDLELDGTNLPRVVGALLRSTRTNGAKPKRGNALDRWTEHLRFALDGLESIQWATRSPDNAEYLTLKFANGLECPSWLLSDGTLRMLALTLPAFLESRPSVYMVEEPENGMHPHALEIIIKALAAIPDAQTFIATHSPMVVELVGPKPLLCFRKEPDRGVVITPGDRHPALKDWDGSPDLASIFAARVLG